MLCVRCSHPLSPRADRCLRCFALNPQNVSSDPAPRVAMSIESDPPARPALNIASDPPALVEVLSVASEPPETGEWRLSRAEAAFLARTEPDEPVAPPTVPFA